MVGVGDFRGNVALGDTVYVFRRNVEWAYHGVESLVHAFHYLAEFAPVQGGVGASRELALDGGLGQHVGVGD